jgi:hypothetical protein
MSLNPFAFLSSYALLFLQGTITTVELWLVALTVSLSIGALW